MSSGTLPLLAAFIGEIGEIGNVSRSATVAEPVERLRGELLVGSDFVNRGSSTVHHTARVHDSAIVENSYIGPGVVIHQFACVRDSVVRKSVTLGHCVEVSRSYIGSRSVVPHFNYIGDTFIGADVKLGGGVRTANRRLDEGLICVSNGNDRWATARQSLGAIVGDRCRLGGSVHLNPGVLIGAGCIVDPGLELARGVPPDMRVRRSTDYRLVRLVNDRSRSNG